MSVLLRRSVLVAVGRVLLAMALFAAAVVIFFAATPQGTAAFRAA